MGSARRVVVTGAASGIGAALAARLVDGGHRVIGVDRTGTGVPAGVRTVTCDLTDPAATARAAEEITRAVSTTGLHGIAAVAGVPGTAPPETVYAVNTIGLRRFVDLLVPRLSPGSAIVLLSSMAGYRGGATDAEAAELLDLDDDALAARLAGYGHDGPAAYQLSKQLVHHHALRLAARLHGRSVRGLSISPGPVETPILADFRATMPTLDAACSLVGRNARPDEVAAVAEFALSPAASWLNGLDLRLDGGLTALRAAAVADPAGR